MKHSWLTILFFFLWPLHSVEKLVILLVIDSLSHESLKKIKPYLSGGLAQLLSKGTNFENAHYQYAHTTTGPGHATLSTGCWPSMHGIVANNWYSYEGKKMYCVQGQPEKDTIFPPCGTVEKERSAHNFNVDGIADQLALSPEGNDSITLAFGMKSRTAICMATRMGKAIWFDQEEGKFATSKAYFDQMPLWLDRLNKKHVLAVPKEYLWKPYFDMNNKAYAAADHTISKKSFINTVKAIKSPSHFYTLYKYFPQSNQHLLDCAYTALQEHAANKQNILLCIGLGSLDKINHRLGPDSHEYYDTLYHIDAYLKGFLEKIATSFANTQIMICLTADHGNVSIPEDLQKKRFSLAQRFNAEEICTMLNKKIAHSYGINDLVLGLNNSSLYLHQQKLEAFDYKTQKNILYDIKKILLHHPCFKKVWLDKELLKINARKRDFVTYLQNQHFPGRSGSLYYQLSPYCALMKHPSGNIHHAPYNYTTHVPLIIMQSKDTKQRLVKRPVWITQLAPTIGDFFGIPKPSACLQISLAEVNLHSK